MTPADHAAIAAVQSQLRMAAIRYATFFLDPAADPAKVREAEYVLATAARTFVTVIDSIDPKLWEPPHTR